MKQMQLSITAPQLKLVRLFALSALAILALAQTGRAQTLTPLSLTGYNADVIVGVGETAPGFTTDFGHGAQYRLFENGLDTSDPTFGLPTSRTFISSTNSNVEFQFAPYAGNNVAQTGDVNGNTSLTLAVGNPGQFTQLAFLDTSNGGANFTITLNFSDSTSTLAIGEGIGDIYGGPAGVLANVGSQTNTGFYTGPTALYEQDFTLSQADSLKTLTSITVNGPESFYFLAASGSAAPEPSTYAMLIAGLGLLVFARRFSKNRTA